VLPAAYLAPDQAGCLQHADVTRHPGKRHRQRTSEIADPGITTAQRDKQSPPGGIGQRGLDFPVVFVV